MPYLNELRDHIKVVPNVLSEENRRLILDTIKASEFWEPARVEGAVENKLIRNCDILGISHNRSQSAALEAIDPLVFKAVEAALQEYAKPYGFDMKISKDSGYEALRYAEGGFYGTHTDSTPTHYRIVSCSLALNDDYEGGEWAFWGEEVKLRVPAGSAVLFPSNYTYPHQIMPITKGTRYSIITWLS